MKEIIIAYDNSETNPIMGEWVGELVRCKDCKKCDLPEEEPYENGYCSRCGYVKMDWFCADGKHK